MTITQNLSMPIDFEQFLELKEVALNGKWQTHFQEKELLFVNHGRRQTLRIRHSADGIFAVSAIWSKETLNNFDDLIQFIKKEGN